MKANFVVIFFLIILLLPIGNGFSQLSQTLPTLGLDFVNFTPFNYKAEDGTTIIIGEVENKKNFPVSSVKIWAGFYNNISEQPLESTIGTTILNVIPPFGKSPYVIKSPSPNSAITSVSVNLLGFNSAPSKQTSLVLESGEAIVDEQVKISGSITNNGKSSSQNTKIHAAFYDVFIPPRILWIATTTIDEADLQPGATASFEFDEKFNSAFTGVKLMAESTSYYSKIIDMPISSPRTITKLVTIGDSILADSAGNKISNISVGSIINIQSGIWIQYSADQESYDQPYVYYTQIKQSGDQAVVEFIGQQQDMFQGASKQFPSVEWTPQKKGLYFVETFVWDTDGVPLASKGPIILVLVT